MTIRERNVSTEERDHDHARLAGVPAGRLAGRSWAYILGDLSPDSRGASHYAYKLYERHPISGRWCFAYWVPVDEVDDDKDLCLDNWGFV